MPNVFFHIKRQSYLKSKKEQIVEGITEAIVCGDLAVGDPLPSINKMIARLDVSRMTVVRAFDALKEMGLVMAEDKVGYFVRGATKNRALRIFLFLGEFRSYHEILYHSILESLEPYHITVDVFFHHFNPKAFRAVLRDNLGAYGLYIIAGFDGEGVREEMARVPSGKLLQILRAPLLPERPAIYQDFSEGLGRALDKRVSLWAKYDRFVLVFPQAERPPESIVRAFTEFCARHAIDGRIDHAVRPGEIVKGTAFWVIDDGDLLRLIQGGEEAGLQLGTDYGILSYNETPLKAIIRQGITVVSVDFLALGREIAYFVIERDSVHKVFEPDVIVRNSL